MASSDVAATQSSRVRDRPCGVEFVLSKRSMRIEYMLYNTLKCRFILRFTDRTYMAPVFLSSKELGTIDETKVIADALTCKARSHVCM